MTDIKTQMKINENTRRVLFEKYNEEQAFIDGINQDIIDGKAFSEERIMAMSEIVADLILIAIEVREEKKRYD